MLLPRTVISATTGTRQEQKTTSTTAITKAKKQQPQPQHHYQLKGTVHSVFDQFVWENGILLCTNITLRREWDSLSM